MILIENFEHLSTTYDPEKKLLGHYVTCYQENERDEDNPVISLVFSLWYDENSTLVQIYFEELYTSLEEDPNTLKLQILNEFYGSNLFKEYNKRTVKEILEKFEAKLTKEHFDLIETESENEHSAYNIYTNIGYILIEVNKQFEVVNFLLDDWYLQTIKGAFDWEQIFFKRVRNQIRLRHLFK